MYGYYYFKRKWLVVIYIFLLVSFAANLLSFIFNETCNWFVFIFAPLYFLCQFYCYFYQVNIMIKRDFEVHGKEIRVETIVTNEYIQNTASTGAVNKLEFDKIKKASHTKNLILLRTNTNLIFVLRKDTFTKGNKDDFVHFLSSKGIKTK